MSEKQAKRKRKALLNQIVILEKCFKLEAHIKKNTNDGRSKYRLKLFRSLLIAKEK